MSNEFVQKDGVAYMTSIKGKPAEVWWRNDTHMADGGYNHYWLRVPKEMHHRDEEVFIPYTEAMGSLVRPTRPLWGLKVEQDLKVEWENWKHGDSVGGMTRIEITLHGKAVWKGTSYNDLFRATAYAHSIILRLEDLPVDLNEHDRDIKGRRIWYYDQPAIIQEYQMPDDRLVMVYDDPDETKGFNMVQAQDAESDFPVTSWHGSHIVHDSIFSKHIWWFRDGSKKEVGK